MDSNCRPHTRKYIKDNDWTELGSIIVPEKGKPFNPKQEEFLVQDQSVLILIDLLKFFAKKALNQHKLPQFKKYVKHIAKKHLMLQNEEMAVATIWYIV